MRPKPEPRAPTTGHSAGFFVPEVSMQVFWEALAVVLGHEGDDSTTDDPRDPGGLTRFGISSRAHPSVDVRNLTRELAAEIYRTHYWAPMQCGRFAAPIALCVFDCAVNQGTTAATRLPQEVVGVKVDGVLGELTVAAVNRRPTVELIKRFQTARMKRYIKTGGFTAYGHGWSARVIDVTATAVQWACEAFD